MSRTMRSPMIQRRELQPKRSAKHFWLVALIAYGSALVATLFLNWTDRLSDGWQIFIAAVILAGCALWAFHMAAREEGMTSIEYLCYVVELARRYAW